jgi:hypothetical protein
MRKLQAPIRTSRKHVPEGRKKKGDFAPAALVPICIAINIS